MHDFHCASNKRKEKGKISNSTIREKEQEAVVVLLCLAGGLFFSVDTLHRPASHAFLSSTA